MKNINNFKENYYFYRRISDIKPHPVQDTISVNYVRTKIMNLRKPIALITENISNEIEMCERHEKKIEEFTGDIVELRKELYTPALDIVSEALEKPITVCSDPECCEKISLDNTTKIHYKSICHKPCYLENSDGNIIGDAALLDCRAFNKYERFGEGDWFSRETFVPDSNLRCNENGLAFGGECKRTKSENCFKCSHSYQVHLNINYETKIQTKQILDENKYERIETSYNDIDLRQYQINRIQAKVEQIKEELRFITECSAHFARFLMNNAITPFNDALEDYIKCCIANEEKVNGDAVLIKGFHDMLEAYNREKVTIEKLSEDTQGESDLTSVQIDQKIGQLFKLKNYGHVIKYHMQLEAQGRQKTKIALEKNVNINMGKSNVFIAAIKRIFSNFKW